MTSLLFGLLLSCVIGLPQTARPVDGPEDDRRTIFEQGITYEDFLADADRRVHMWKKNYAADIDADLLDRVAVIEGNWKLLVVAVDACSDAVSTVPYVAKLAAIFDNIDLRIVDSDVGREVMEDYRTPDGRAATPTIVLLDADYEEVGCFIERPQALLDWADKHGVDLVQTDAVTVSAKLGWYANDGGRHTLEAIVEMLEAGQSGGKGC